MTRLFTTDDGEVVGFTCGDWQQWAIVRYGDRLRAYPLEDLTVTDPDDAQREAAEREQAAWERSRQAMIRSNPVITNAIAGPQTGRGVR